MPQAKQQLVNDDQDYDLDPYYVDTQDKSEKDNWWLMSVAGLLGAAFVTSSLNPTGSIEAPNLADVPTYVHDISDQTFNDIMRMDMEQLKLGEGVENLSYAYSPEDLQYFQQMAEDLKQYGRLEDPRSIENTGFRWAEQSNDKMGMFGDIEAYKSGALDQYIWAQNEYGAEILIPWNPTGGNTCPDCMDKVDEGPYKPDEFPEPVHFGDQCNEPMADPIIVFPTGEDTVIPLEA
jgi:hypothetical protein